MIHDVDAAIRTLIRRDAANGDVDVVFDAPNREWSAKRSTPTINVFLFDIREDVGRRRVELEPVRDDQGVVIGRRRPPRRYRLSYLVTAWTQRPEDEHRLLSVVLHTFLPYEEMPREVLEGGAADQPLPVFVTIGLPPPAERSIGEIWSAMGGELKPSVELVLSVPFVISELRHAGAPVQEEPRFDFEDPTGRTDTAPGARRRLSALSAAAAQTAEDDVVTEQVQGGTNDNKGRVITISTVRR